MSAAPPSGITCGLGDQVGQVCQIGDRIGIGAVRKRLRYTFEFNGLS